MSSTPRTVLVTGGDPSLWSGVREQWVARGWRVIHARSEDDIGDALALPGSLDVAILDVSGGSPDASLADWFRAIYPEARLIVVQDSDSAPVPGSVALTRPLDVRDLFKIVDALIDE